MNELLAEGDPPPHVHDLPDLPYVTRTVRIVGGLVGSSGWDIERREVLINAVARCTGCRGLFVSRDDPEGWGPGGRWVPLRWWHRQAHRKLRDLAP